MHAFLMEDWITVRGASANPASTVTQGEEGWLDLSPFQDVVIWLDVREVTGATPTINFETAPAKDESLFLPLFAAPTNLAASANPTVLRATMFSANVPLARYLRWKITGPVSTLWDASFRILIAANSPGM